MTKNMTGRVTYSTMPSAAQRLLRIEVKQLGLGLGLAWGLVLGLVLLCAATVAIVAWDYRANAAHAFGFDTAKASTLATLPDAQIDRLRMAAAGGHDAAALATLQQAAQAGNVLAMRAAASVLLLSAQKTEQLQGLSWAQLAAQKGDSGAQYLLGKAFFDGHAALPADRQQARAWFASAAGQKNAKAAYFLGLIYQNAYGVKADAVQASRWFKQSADLGNPDAMFMLANAYVAGAGVPTDPARAVQLYQAAAEQEHPLAAQALGYALRDGTLGLKRDSQQSQEMMVEVEHALRHPRPVF